MIEAVATLGESLIFFRASDEHPIRGLQEQQDGVFVHAEVGLAAPALVGLGIGLGYSCWGRQCG